MIEIILAAGFRFKFWRHVEVKIIIVDIVLINKGAADLIVIIVMSCYGRRLFFNLVSLVYNLSQIARD